MARHNRLPHDEAMRRYHEILAPHGGPDAHGLSKTDLFAELICGGADENLAIPPMQAAELMGHSIHYGNAVMQRIRKGLGDWAR